MASSFDIAEARKADKKTNLLVYGFIRDINHMDVASANIPDLILFVIILYLMEKEYFDKHGKFDKISDDKLTVTSTLEDDNLQEYDNTTYGHQWIPSISKVIVTWKFKGKNNRFIMMGITSNDNCQSYDFSINNKATTYAFTSDGQWSTENGKSKATIDNAIIFKRDDKISFILDLINREILIQVNDNEKKVLWTDIKVSDEIKYKLAVCMVWNKNEITLIDFNMEYL